MKVFLGDQGLMGYKVRGSERSSSYIGLKYPEDKDVEHLRGMGLWVGARIDTGRTGNTKEVKLVTTTDNPDSVLCQYVSNTIASDSTRSWYHTSNLYDSTAISESDYACEYTDTVTGRLFGKHIPLGIKVIQKSYAWANAVRVPVLPFDYILVNIGKHLLRDVYIGFHIEAEIYPLDKPFGLLHGLDRIYHGYWPDVLTAYVDNPVDEGITPFGVTILKTPKRLDTLRYFVRWIPYLLLGDIDSVRYQTLTGEVPIAGAHLPIMDDQPAIQRTWSYSMISFGPIPLWSQGETLNVSMALVGGQSLRYTPDNVYENARFAQTLFARHYKPPLVLPVPKLQIETGYRKIALRWGRSDSSVDPRDVWDEENNLAQFYPPDHWRRINPPHGKIRGGRVFEGFRLYRSEDPTGTTGSFTLLHQWDVIDSVGPRYEYDVGIETTFVDSNLNTNKTYWYAVTSFGIPDLHTIDYVDRDGTVKVETLFTKSAETSVLASRKRVNIPFSVSTNVGEVKVVPNPYRVDEDYTYENGGWEGRARSWTEDKRIIKFIHLPPTCTIRIFTIAGDVITTLHHDNPTRGELSWNLISESGRAIASGVYIFTVESDLGKQMGKFAVIR